jgi:ankyrin repeat protein
MQAQYVHLLYVCMQRKLNPTSFTMVCLLISTHSLQIKYVSSSKDLVNDTDDFGHTAAFYALQQGHNVCLSVLLNAGADPNGIIDSSANKRSPASYGEHYIAEFISCYIILSFPNNTISARPYA